MENVENIYPLSPMQEMMLLHVLGNPSADTLFNQFCYDLQGPLDVDAFVTAWQVLVDRHDSLRTQFAWEDLKRPMQVVRTKLELPYTFLDFSQVTESANTNTNEVDAYLLGDRERGFPADQAPLMRIALLKLAEDKHIFVWSSHHLVVDRWCISTLLEELHELLAEPTSRVLPQAPSFAAYIAWIQKQQRAVTDTYWQTYLAGYQPLSILSKGLRDSGLKPQPEVAVELDPEFVQQLRHRAQSCSATLNSFMHLGLALTINQLVGRQDSVFGTATSGRPTELLDVEKIVGSFVANVPTRVRLPKDLAIAEILRSVQRDSQERLRHEYAATSDLVRTIAPQAQWGLFDILVIWLGEAGSLQLPGIFTSERMGSLETACPVTLGVADRQGGLRLTAKAQAGVSLVVELDLVLNELVRVLGLLTEIDLSISLAEFPGFKGELTQGQLSRNPAVKPPLFDRSSTATSPSAGREASDSQMLRELVMSGWQQTLGTLPDGDEVDFFSAGGDSQSAVKLHQLLESATGLEIPLLSLFQCSTISEMVEFLARPAWGLKPQVLVPIRSTGEQTPLFFVASPEVNTLGYSLLSRYLPSDLPVYLLQALPQQSTVDRLAVTQLPDIAADYVAKMRSVQPNGPYRLLGMCSGAQITHEMTVLLEERGEQAEFVGFVNTWSHFTVGKTYKLHRWSSKVRWYATRLRQVGSLDGAARNAVIRSLIAKRFPFLAVDRGSVTTAELDPVSDHPVPMAAESVAEVAEQESSWIEEFGWTDAPAAQNVQKSDTSYTVFRIHKQPFWRTGQVDLGWSKFSKKPTAVVNLATEKHLDIMREPHVRLLAEALRNKLDKQ